jgi:CheY-like chemotaxis protein
MSLHILLVEDNPDNREMLARRLTRRGHRLSFAVDGAAAIALPAGSRPIPPSPRFRSSR